VWERSVAEVLFWFELISQVLRDQRGFGMKKSLLLIWLLASIVFGQKTFHIYSPWATDSARSANPLYATGGFSDWNANANTLMTNEGGGFFSFTFAAISVDWWTTTVKNCLADGSGCVNWAITPKLIDVFGGENEVWIYPDASTSGYHTTLMPPGAKIVWFKSPWNNRSIPNMIVGTDSVRMHFGTDAGHCGWFWGALRGAQITAPQVYFQRRHTDNTVPATGVIDLTTALSTSDSAFVDGTVTPASVAQTIGTSSACFDSSHTIHVLNPWDDDPDHRTLPIYISGGNTLQQVAMTKDVMDGWWVHTIASTVKINTAESINISSSYPWPDVSPPAYADHPTFAELFPAGEYEVWIVPKGDSNLFLMYSLQMRTINLLNPWSSAVPRLLLNGDTIIMRSISDTCGWYRARVYENPAAWDVRFPQALGSEVYSGMGLVDGAPVPVDSVMQLGMNAWIQPVPYPTGTPKISSNFPGILGDCPSRELAVMIFDWSDNDPDFGGTYNNCGAASGGLVSGMVEKSLSAAGLPLKAAAFPDSLCTEANNLNNWFVPQVITGTYTNATCYNLPLTMDDAGFWLADIAQDTARKIDGFFPIDSWKFLDSAMTIPNPKNEPEAPDHNFSYTMHVNATFSYVPGQYFEFRGDDDVWVFINNKLVVDLGGVHGPLKGSVSLDTLALTPGVTYPFHIFYAERNCCGANFKMRTSMDLHTDRTFYPLQVKTSDGTLRYEIWQILKEKSLRCDFTTTSAADTVKAPSTFLLSGPQFPNGPVQLNGGVNYGGIVIDTNYSGFTIDTLAIVASRTLAPGTYKLTFTHALDPSLSSEVTFVVPDYPLPTIVFTDSLWKEISPDTVTLGEWAFVPYPVHIEARYVGVKCADCTDQIMLDTEDSLVFLDANRNIVNSIALDSGRATFWVMGQKSLDTAKFRAYGASVSNELWWKKIKLKEPPVPFLRNAAMFDRNGDGVGDSLVMAYSKSLKGKDAPDSLLWRWGTSTNHMLDSEQIAKSLFHDSLIVIKDDTLASIVFTGTTDGKLYQGSSITWFTYIPTEGADKGIEVPFEISAAVDDRIGPLVLSAEMSPGRILDTLYVNLSESLPSDSIAVSQLFQFRVWRSGVERSTDVSIISSLRRVQGSRYVLTFINSSEIFPVVGDSIRLVPVVGMDVAGNTAHQLNPWVRITGKQRSTIESIDMVDLSPVTAPKESGPSIRIVKTPSGQSVKDLLNQEGVLGHLIRFDMANVIANSTLHLTPKDVVLEFQTRYFTNLGTFVNEGHGKVSCADSLFDGDCTKNPGNLFIGWNMRSKNGRLAATGAYVSEIHYKVRMKGLVTQDQSSREVWGVRRKK